jgi:hypothetical protein
MLDAYIIQRIRQKERDDAARVGEGVPLHVPTEDESALPVAPPRVERQESTPDVSDRGIVEVDFSI